MEEKGIEEFQDYLIEMEQIKEEEIKEKMKKLGLFFV